MKTVTTHQAKTHLSRLIKEVQAGETILILNGKTPVARLTGTGTPGAVRPKVGMCTSEPVRCAEDAFLPLADDALEEWGL